ARFTVTSVTRRDYKRPLQIAAFLNELNAGFRLLNLKNDGLRKKFDSLKYDIKKVEGVVYDLSIRNFYNEEDPK
ncbi:Translin, partial [Caligus rogercresseyi]